MSSFMLTIRSSHTAPVIVAVLTASKYPSVYKQASLGSLDTWHVASTSHIARSANDVGSITSQLPHGDLLRAET